MTFYVGDNPRVMVQIDPAPLAVEDFESVDAELVAPDNSSVAATATFSGDSVAVQLPVDPFPFPGVYGLRVTLTTENTSQSLPSVPLVAEERTGWHTLDSAREEWRDAPDNDAKLYDLLETAREQCARFAPALAEDTPVPSRYRVAQLMQARNVWNASKTDPGSGGIGVDGFVIRPYPMDGTVKNVLRPKTAVPVIA